MFFTGGWDTSTPRKSTPKTSAGKKTAPPSPAPAPAAAAAAITPTTSADAVAPKAPTFPTSTAAPLPATAATAHSAVPPLPVTAKKWSGPPPPPSPRVMKKMASPPPGLVRVGSKANAGAGGSGPSLPTHTSPPSLLSGTMGSATAVSPPRGTAMLKRIVSPPGSAIRLRAAAPPTQQQVNGGADPVPVAAAVAPPLPTGSTTMLAGGGGDTWRSPSAVSSSSTRSPPSSHPLPPPPALPPPSPRSSSRASSSNRRLPPGVPLKKILVSPPSSPPSRSSLFLSSPSGGRLQSSPPPTPLRADHYQGSLLGSSMLTGVEDRSGRPPPLPMAPEARLGPKRQMMKLPPGAVIMRKGTTPPPRGGRPPPPPAPAPAPAALTPITHRDSESDASEEPLVTTLRPTVSPSSSSLSPPLPAATTGSEGEEGDEMKGTNTSGLTHSITAARSGRETPESAASARRTSPSRPPSPSPSASASSLTSTEFNRPSPRTDATTTTTTTTAGDDASAATAPGRIPNIPKEAESSPSLPPHSSVSPRAPQPVRGRKKAENNSPNTSRSRSSAGRDGDGHLLSASPRLCSSDELSPPSLTNTFNHSSSRSSRDSSRASSHTSGTSSRADNSKQRGERGPLSRRRHRPRPRLRDDDRKDSTSVPTPHDSPSGTASRRRDHCSRRHDSRPDNSFASRKDKKRRTPPPISSSPSHPRRHVECHKSHRLGDRHHRRHRDRRSSSSFSSSSSSSSLADELGDRPGRGLATRSSFSSSTLSSMEPLERRRDDNTEEREMKKRRKHSVCKKMNSGPKDTERSSRHRRRAKGSAENVPGKEEWKEQDIAQLFHILKSRYTQLSSRSRSSTRGDGSDGASCRRRSPMGVFPVFTPPPPPRKSRTPLRREEAHASSTRATPLRRRHPGVGVGVSGATETEAEPESERRQDHSNGGCEEVPWCFAQAPPAAVLAPTPRRRPHGTVNEGGGRYRVLRASASAKARARTARESPRNLRSPGLPPPLLTDPPPVLRAGSPYSQRTLTSAMPGSRKRTTTAGEKATAEERSRAEAAVAAVASSSSSSSLPSAMRIEPAPALVRFRASDHPYNCLAATEDTADEERGEVEGVRGRRRRPPPPPPPPLRGSESDEEHGGCRRCSSSASSLREVVPAPAVPLMSLYPTQSPPLAPPEVVVVPTVAESPPAQIVSEQSPSGSRIPASPRSHSSSSSSSATQYAAIRAALRHRVESVAQQSSLPVPARRWASSTLLKPRASSSCPDARPGTQRQHVRAASPTPRAPLPQKKNVASPPRPARCAAPPPAGGPTPIRSTPTRNGPAPSSSSHSPRPGCRRPPGAEADAESVVVHTRRRLSPSTRIWLDRVIQRKLRSGGNAAVSRAVDTLGPLSDTAVPVVDFRTEFRPLPLSVLDGDDHHHHHHHEDDDDKGREKEAEGVGDGDVFFSTRPEGQVRCQRSPSRRTPAGLGSEQRGRTPLRTRVSSWSRGASLKPTSYTVHTTAAAAAGRKSPGPGHRRCFSAAVRPSPWALGPSRDVVPVLPGKPAARRRLRSASSAGGDHCGVLVEEIHLDEQQRPYVVVKEIPSGAAARSQRDATRRLSQPRRRFSL